MNSVDDKIISEITVRLRQNDSIESTIGTGILYYEKSLDDKVYTLTASHNLFEKDSFECKRDSIIIDIYSPEQKLYIPIIYNRIDENLLFKDEYKDVAVLILDKTEVDKINPNIPTINVIKERQSYTSFHIKGFPQATKGQELDVIDVVWKQEMTESKRFQLQLNADYTSYQVDGFSGSGIFLEAHNTVYLYGIFARYREENKGRVIYCQYIDTANELLRNNYYQPIPYTYLGIDGLTPSFFSSKIENAVKNLGARFHEELNFELPIARIFDTISNNDIFHKQFVKVVDDWLTERSYHKKNGNEYLTEIETELELLRQELKDWITAFNHTVDEKITLESFLNKVRQFSIKVTDKQHELFNLERDKEKLKKQGQNPVEEAISRLRTISRFNYDFISDIDDLHLKLVNSPSLIIQGEAGCGKSHLLGDIATQRKKQNLPTLLLLGQHFNNAGTIEGNILTQLGVSCSFGDLIKNLNDIGLQINSRVLILIDAINEGTGVDFWKNRIAGFMNEIAKYPAVGLVLTIRSTYFNDIIPAHFATDLNITIITHEGFKGSEYQALKFFCEHYQLKLPNIPILNPEYAKPLFLHLICEAVKDLPDKSFPKGFNGINKMYNLYKDSLNRRFEEKKDEYKLRNIVTKSIEKLATALFETEYRRLSIPNALLLFDNEFPNNKYLLSDLIEEGLLIKSRTEYDNTDFVFFSYQRLGDYFMAEELLKPYSYKEEVIDAFTSDTKFKKIIEEHQWEYRGIMEAFSVLLPEKYELEIYEIVDFFIDKNADERVREHHILDTYEWFARLLLDGLKLRDLSSIDNKKISEWLNEFGYEYIDNNEWFYTLTELATIQNHPFNSDRLHEILARYSMSQRDSFLQRYIWGYNQHNDYGVAFPIRRLIDWAWSPDVSYSADSETVRLAAQTLSWILSTTIVSLRDETTKALVNLLEQQPDVLIQTLKTFNKVDDWYIKERLYVVAYGCVLRTEHDSSIKKIAGYVYKTIFDKGNPPTHILVRDYARNIIEYALYRNVGLNINEKLIRPPYNSKMPKMPSEEDIEIYEFDYDSPDYGKGYRREQNEIISSVTSIISDFKKMEIDARLDNFHHTSFREEEDYKTYLNSLNRKKKSLLKQLEKFIRYKRELEQRRVFHSNPYPIDIEKGIEMMDSCIKYCRENIQKCFTKEEQEYLDNKIIPFFEKKYKPNNDSWKTLLDGEPIKRWIIQRVFNLGWDRKIHGEYDSIAERYYGYGNNVYEMERIGKKYQWIALYEILGMLTDNYKIEDEWNDSSKYTFYKGAWQLYLRNIDPSFTTRMKYIDNDKIKSSRDKKWWEDDEYTHWNCPDTEWVTTLSDLVNPKKIIQKKDDFDEDWLRLRYYKKWEEPKKIGKDKYFGRRKDVFYLIESYLVRKTDKLNIIKYLENRNLWGRQMPERRDEHSLLFNREKFWSPAYLDTYQSNKRIWYTIPDTSYKVLVTTEAANGGIENDKSGACGSYRIPCKYIFEKMQLQYAPVDGLLKNMEGEIIVFNHNLRGVLIKKKGLIQFLNENKLEIIWTVLGEKLSFIDDRNEESYFKVPCGVFWLNEHGKMEGELKMYDRY